MCHEQRKKLSFYVQLFFFGRGTWNILRYIIVAFRKVNFPALLLAIAPRSCASKLPPIEAQLCISKSKKKMDANVHLFLWQGLKDDYRTYCGIISFSNRGEDNA
ncbi:hypothetical protein CMN24_03130 [Candidatus Saccharibacteria bacterium]|nr:hypothetical protein [Candidatus Saccharibacteria bacterium]